MLGKEDGSQKKKVMSELGIFRGNSVHSHRVSFYSGIFVERHIRYVTKAAFAIETIVGTAVWQHFPPLSLCPLACFTFVQDTPRMQVALGIIRDWSCLCSVHSQEHEILRMWYNSATGMWSRKRRNVLWGSGESANPQEQTTMHCGQLSETLKEAKGCPKAQACCWKVLDKDGGTLGRHDSSSFILH